MDVKELRRQAEAIAERYIPQQSWWGVDHVYACVQSVTDAVAQAVTERDEEWEAILEVKAREQAEEIARLRADIADNERRIGHREEKIAMIQDLKCPTCAEFQDHFENQKQNIKTLERTVRQLKQITPRRDERLAAAWQARDAMQRRAEAAEGDWQAVQAAVAAEQELLITRALEWAARCKTGPVTTATYVDTGQLWRTNGWNAAMDYVIERLPVALRAPTKG